MKNEAKNNIIIKKPDLSEAKEASKLIERESNMVDRNAGFIEKFNYFVAIDKEGKVVGVIGLVDWEHDGVELVSHVVDETYRGMGVGKMLFERLLEKTKRMNTPRFFLCTTRVEFYERLGFVVSSPDILSEKIRSDCAKCPKGPHGPGFGQCPEVVMIYADQKAV